MKTIYPGGGRSPLETLMEATAVVRLVPMLEYYFWKCFLIVWRPSIFSSALPSSVPCPCRDEYSGEEWGKNCIPDQILGFLVLNLWIFVRAEKNGRGWYILERTYENVLSPKDGCFCLGGRRQSSSTSCSMDEYKGGNIHHQDPEIKAQRACVISV